METLRYIAFRFLNFSLLVWVGVTLVFVLMRFIPVDPIEALIGNLSTQGASMSQEQMNAIRQSLTDAFGLEGTLWEQYWRFLSRNILTFDFGVSFSSYPTTVNELIGRAMPWTIGLLISAAIIGWILGNVIGLFAGIYPRRRVSQIAEFVALTLYPIPYYVLALLLSICFSYIIPIFPLSVTIRGDAWTLSFIWDVIYNSFLPALSIVIGVFGWWVISVKALSSQVNQEEFVRFARLRSIPERRVVSGYILPNTLLPQITLLAIQIGLMFSGSILTEILFQYPGLGLLLYSAVGQGDYNLMMGIIQVSIIAVAVATFLLDIFYPLLDPRVRYK